MRFAPFPCHHYKPKRILGAGAFGTAFLCHDECMNEDVVVKSLHAYDPEHGMEVFAETQLLRALSNGAPVHHSRTHLRLRQRTRDARPYIVMDYFLGGSLADFVQYRRTLSLDELIVVAREIADAMQAAHQKGILHRDLKPANVLAPQAGSELASADHRLRSGHGPAQVVQAIASPPVREPTF